LIAIAKGKSAINQKLTKRKYGPNKRGVKRNHFGRWG
jgi:hypothetical protein